MKILSSLLRNKRYIIICGMIIRSEKFIVELIFNPQINDATEVRSFYIGMFYELLSI